MTELYIERFGHGSPLVFLHGWGMSRNLFRNFALEFAAEHTIWLVDLPGYGSSELLQQGAEMQHIVRSLQQHLPADRAYALVGWSLGALVALQIAANSPRYLTRLVLLTATPRFVASRDWPSGVSADALHQVGVELAENYAKAMNRFLQLQLKNLPGARDTIRDIKTVLAMEPAPSTVALQQGLALLESTDLRQSLSTISTPTLILNGDRDNLVSTKAARILAEKLPDAHAVILHGAGHLPFITHAQACRQLCKDFLA